MPLVGLSYEERGGTVPVLREQAARLLGRLGVTIDDHAAGPGGTPLQVGALPYRRSADTVELLLITSRRSRRWILPKGWPSHGQALHDSAAREAYEEAGVRGEISAQPVGHFNATKGVTGAGNQPPVLVFPLRVEEELGDWPERQERSRRWFAPQEALATVSIEQRAIIEAFATPRG